MTDDPLWLDCYTIDERSKDVLARARQDPKTFGPDELNAISDAMERLVEALSLIVAGQSKDRAA